MGLGVREFQHVKEDLDSGIVFGKLRIRTKALEYCFLGLDYEAMRNDGSIWRSL